MSSHPAPHPSTTPNRTARGLTWACAAAIALLVLAAYANSFHGPLIFDDLAAIRENPTIRDLGNWQAILNPPRENGVTVNGRPLVNLTLALNYALDRDSVVGFHVLNLGIHLSSALVLFGLLRRATARFLGPHPKDQTATLFAAALAGWWALHPLQTQSVTYVVQRAESLLGLLYLTALYCFARSGESRRPLGWQVAALIAALLGTLTKEVIVSLPIVAFLYDRTFLSGSFAQAWRRHRGFHLALAAIWIPLAWQISRSGGRGGTVGFGLNGVEWWMYTLTQADALVRYLRLSFWPNGLVFDYGTGIETEFQRVLPQLALVVGILVVTVVGLRRTPVLGFLGACFFLVLAPSSSVVPIVTESMAEHRMYLPLLAVIGVSSIALHRLIGGRLWLPAAGIAIGLAAVTGARNQDYQSEMRLWLSAVQNYPASARAQNNYGEMLARHRRYDEAIARYREAIRLLPDYRDALCNLGGTLHKIGRMTEGMAIIRQLIVRYPDNAEVVSTYGGALYREGRIEEARIHFEKAIQLNPQYAEAHNNLAVILNDNRQPLEAISHLKVALLNRPNYPDALYNYANSLAQTGDLDGAADKLRQTFARDPGYAQAYNNLGAILMQQGKADEAGEQFAQAVRLRPDYADALNNLGVVRFGKGEVTEALKLFEQALALQPTHADARRNQIRARAALGLPAP